MTEDYLKNIMPDSISGIIFAFEGIKNTVVLLNGPTGCKFYHSATSDNMVLRKFEYDPLNYPEELYFGQPRVPCTYLDKRDYVYGSGEKLREALAYINEHQEADLMAVVNSPGAALIGDDLKRLIRDEMPSCRTVTVQTPGASEYIWDGYRRAFDALFDDEDGRADGLSAVSCGEGALSVNILGLSIFHKYREGTVNELDRMLSMNGIRLNTVLFCGCSVNELEELGRARLNIVLDPLYGLGPAERLKELYGTPYIVCDGLPVGFKAAEQFISDVCGALGTEPTEEFRAEAEKSREVSYGHISRVNSLTGMPKGVPCAVQGTTFEVLGYVRCLTGYFGMMPVCVSVTDKKCINDDPVSRHQFEELKGILEDAGASAALAADITETAADIVLADGNTIAILKESGYDFTGIETSLPSLGYIDVIPKTHAGLSGALLLCEQILNGLPY